MSEKRAVVFRDLLTATKDGDWGKGEPQQGYTPVHVIRGTDFTEVGLGRVSGVPLRYLSENTLHRRLLRADDIVIETAGGSRDQPTGRTVFISQEVLDAFPGDATCASFARFLRVDPAVASPRYVYWYLQYLYARGDMWTHQVQHTGVARFQFTRFADTEEVPLPTRTEQDAIAGVLGALDDKIAVNERIAVTADDLMRALYQESCDSASESIALGKIGRLVRDSVHVSSLTGSEHYIGLEHMPRRNMWLSTWESNAELASGKSAFRAHDVLFGRLRPYFHKVGLALTSGVCSTDILVVRPVEEANLGWLLLALSSDEVVAHASAVGDGTRMPRTKWKDLESLDVPWPGSTEANRLNDIVRPLAARVQASAAESRTLAALRDTLLRQLMSGRLRVKDAEKMVEDQT